MRVSSLTSSENRATFPGQSAVQRRYVHLNGVAGANIANIRLRHWNHQAEVIVLGEAHQRHSLRARTGSSLHQCPQIRVPLRYHACKRGRDIRVIEQRLIVRAFRLGDLKLALSRLEV